jgi:oxygen-independent coproporphyrinogen-3 oxidase
MAPVSSLYLHVPFCRHLCNYCDFYKRSFDAPGTQIEDFHRFLRRSWERHEELLREHGAELGALETLYLGGGTPSLWGEAGAAFLGELPLELASDCEFTMEVDPGTWTPAMLASWQKLGLNRLSIGTQSLNPEFLRIMDRAHSVEESRELLEFCRSGAWNFSMDFLLGLPFSVERQRSIERELEELLSYRPTHVSLYILNARSKYPHTAAIPDDEFIRQEYLRVSELLTEAGFHHYEVSNFALPGKESRHNERYWQGVSVAALGPTGTGYLALQPGKAFRYKWKVSAAEVEAELLGPTELALERTYLELRTGRGWTPSVLSPGLEKLLQRWQELGYGQLLRGTFRASPLGYLMLDSLMDDLFRLR